MISSCPHCKQTLKLGTAQQAKLQKALQALKPGKKLTIKCPSCGKGISLNAGGEKGSRAATGVPPPSPPDLSWLKEGALHDDDKIADVPMALVLHPRNEKLEIVRDALEQVGYQIIVAESVEQAVERMRFVSFACVVQHSHFDGPDLEKSSFHQYMRDMAMQRRRYLFYILIGPEFHTLYNLQALAYSANLVVNEDDLYHMGVAMRKAIPQYEELFGPFMEELTSSGKS
jgi:hypothetical protein